jgi:MYXO-CTERM domain-containing protein
MRPAFLALLLAAACAPSVADNEDSETFGDATLIDTSQVDEQGKADGQGGPQVLYLNFKGTRIAAGDDNPKQRLSRIFARQATLAAFDVDRYWLNTASNSDAMAYIVENVTERFAPFNVRVVTDEPASGPYTMIVVTNTTATEVLGSVTASAKQILQVQGAAGIAPMDCGNNNPANVGFAFGHGAWSPYPKWMVAATIAHEAAHSFGLGHNRASTSLMQPAIDALGSELTWARGTTADKGLCGADGYDPEKPAGQAIDDQAILTANLVGAGGGTGGGTGTKVQTQLTIASSKNPAPVGTEVTLQATVSTKDGSAATGQVTFKDGTTELGKANLTDGKASVKASFAMAGEHVIAVSYAGDATHAASAQMLRQTIDDVPRKSVNVTLAASANPSAVNTDVIFTAMVTPATAGDPAPTGEVTFSKDGVEQAAIEITAGKAQWTVKFAAAGSHTIRASYEGDAVFGVAMRELTQTVGSGGPPPPPPPTEPTVAPCEVMLSGAAPSVEAGEAVRLRAKVTCQTESPPTGKIQFGVDGALRGEATLGPTGEAEYTLNTSGLEGRYQLAAMYLGDATHMQATSAGVSIEITAIPAAAVPPGPGESQDPRREPGVSTKPKAGCSVASGAPDASALLIAFAMLLATRRRRLA